MLDDVEHLGVVVLDGGVGPDQIREGLGVEAPPPMGIATAILHNTVSYCSK